MKPIFIKTIFYISVCTGLSLAFQSCSENDAEADPTAGLTPIATAYAPGAATKLTLYAAEDLFAGYNALYIALFDSTTGRRITKSHISLMPIMTMPTMSHSCPLENPEVNAIKDLFPAAIMFSMPSGDMGRWALYITVEDPDTGLSGVAEVDIAVRSATPSRMISFQSVAGEKYYLGYQFPGKVKVGANQLEVIAFKKDGAAYIPTADLDIKLTPEMPSMDHGSPNNADPIHISKGHYSGTVNFTMSGEWRMNLDISDGGQQLGVKYFDLVVK